MKSNGYRIGLYTDDASINNYVQSQIESVEIVGKSDQDPFEDCAVIYLLDFTSERVEILHNIAVEALSSGVKVIWCVEAENEIEENLRSMGAVILSTDIEDAAQIVYMLNDFLENQTRETVDARIKEAINLESDIDSDLGIDSDGDTFEGFKPLIRNVGSVLRKRINPEEEILEIPDVVENVIAVAGHKGCGSSFIAWNIARVLERPVVLVEGRKTGTLARWLTSSEPTDRDSFLQSNVATQHSEYMDLALLADSEVKDLDLILFSKIPRIIIVDCGDRWDLEIFKRAAKRVFVTSPDPQFIKQGLPEGVKSTVHVLNKYPHGMAIPIEAFEKRVGQSFDIVVPARPRQVAMSLWTERAWITMEPEHSERWKQKFDILL